VPPVVNMFVIPCSMSLGSGVTCTGPSHGTGLNHFRVFVPMEGHRVFFRLVTMLTAVPTFFLPQFKLFSLIYIMAPRIGAPIPPSSPGPGRSGGSGTSSPSPSGTSSAR